MKRKVSKDRRDESSARRQNLLVPHVNGYKVEKPKANSQIKLIRLNRDSLTGMKADQLQIEFANKNWNPSRYSKLRA